MTTDQPANQRSNTPLLLKHPVADPAWLARLSEDIIEPGLPIVDPHHHFYDRPGDSYLLDDLLADLNSGHNVVATVFVQAYWSHRREGPEPLRPVGETDFIMTQVDEAARRGAPQRICAGVVAYADLCLGAAVEPVLAAQAQAAKGRLRGIRNIAARDPGFLASISTPPAFGMMGSPAFREGFAMLAKHGLSFDAWVYHPQIPQLTDLARAFPQVPIVLNHIGGPLGCGPYRGKRREVFEDWRRSMRELASCQNVHMKLGGLGMALGGFDFHDRPLPPSSGELEAAWGPYLLAVIEAFGVERCMFESNFPVDKCSYSYPFIWNAFKRMVSGATADEKAALFHGTATRFYSLQP